MDYLMWLAFMAITGTATLAGSIKIINQGDEALVEFLGRYDGKKLEPGLNFITPFLSQVVFKETTREKVLEISPQTCITRDNVSISVDAVVYWRIINIEKAYYKVQNLQAAIVNLVVTQIRSEMGNLELNETFTARTAINKSLLRDLDTATEPWGVKVTRVELREIVPSKTVQGAMELQMSAERKKQAAILTSEGEREAVVNAARGEAEAQLIEAEARQKAAILSAEAQQKEQILKAQGTAAAMEILGKKLNADPNATKSLQFLLAQNYIEMGIKIGSSGSSKVMFVDPRSIPSTLEGIGSIVGEENNGNVKQIS
ncbi:SPFH domain-containing protein [Aerosakkonema sp. BLCC-F183]|uniref:SPFH domain-containing protein n=1 Tax=Aerosakkonema sp. BLCC-F183 TaxID=3342834 RepID=UPI0035BA70A7